MGIRHLGLWEMIRNYSLSPLFSWNVTVQHFLSLHSKHEIEFRKEKEVVRRGTRALHYLTRVFTVPPVLEAVVSWSVCPLNTHIGFGWDRVTFLHSSSTISICCDYVTILAATKEVGNWKCFWALWVHAANFQIQNVNNSFQSLPCAQKFII